MAVTENQLITKADDCRTGGPVAASTTLYQGTLGFYNATGFVDDDTAAGVNAFAGIVIEQVDNSGGAAGDKDAELYNRGVFTLVGSGFAAGDVGAHVYATDNYTITKTRTAASVYVGTIVSFISATKVKVRIETKGEPVAPIADAGATYTATEQGIINSIIDALEVKGLVEPS